MEKTMAHYNLQVSSASISDKGLSEKRPQNEDAYLELRDSGFFAVADGVGGAQAGDVASQMAIEILGEAFINLPEGGDAEERMELAIEKANSAIFQMSNDLPQLSTMATTIVGLHISENVATIGHVGDSRLYRVDANGDLYRETQDHSVVEEEVRAGRMTPEQAETHPSRNVISRALGAEDTVEVDMKTIMFEPGTTFLICSDGVTRHITDDELRELLFTETDTFAICQYIKKICYERGAEDNLTAVVVKADEKTSESLVDVDLIETESVEEETIAAARPPLVNSDVILDAGAPDKSAADADILQIPSSDPPSASEELKLEDKISIPLKKDREDTLSIQSTGSTDVLELETPSKKKISTDIKSYRIDEKNGSGAIGTLTLLLPWGLLILAVAAASYFWYTSRPALPGVDQLNAQSPDVALTSFETNRRNVDADPAGYIAKYSANPKDAIDYYLLGRAYFLQRNYESAKKNLERSRSMIKEGVAPTNKTVLENEIPMMLAIIESPEAQKTLGNGDADGKDNGDSKK